MISETKYDVIVIGGGHAGCEAALAAARMGARTLLLNHCLDNTALMPCNPSMGGPAKAHLVRECSAMGGEQARASDASAMMMRWLNTSKGPAVRALRAQCDLHDYHDYYIWILETTKNLYLHQDMVTDIVVKDGRVRGVITEYGLNYEADAVILTTGTYLGGRVHIGMHNFASGPLGQMPSKGLGESLRRLGFQTERLKTGTTPRLHLDTIDWDAIELQEGEAEPLSFDFWGSGRIYREISCGVVRTSAETHDIIRDNLDRSPLYTGAIEGVGPRYCPSIESKVIHFPEKDSHPVFLEPVARRSKEVYVQNFSTSLPYDVQLKMTRTLPGCEHAQILRPGYAIEYDYLPPTQLHPSLETKLVRGFFCAGQINGTSGYEEAGAQGLMAGINAVLAIRGEDPLILKRSEAYIGVLIDDLVTKGTKEPYRMLTSRCEHRLLLRCDNADRRLSPFGRKLGLLDDERWKVLQERWKVEDEELKRLEKVRISPSDALNAALAEAGATGVDRSLTAENLLKRPHVSYDIVRRFAPSDLSVDRDMAERIDVTIKYAGYIGRQKRVVERLKGMEAFKIPEDFDYSSVEGMLTESRQKLREVRPETMGQASRISGVTPADLQLLSVALKGHGRRKRRDGQ